MLPGISIVFENGNIGNVVVSADGVFGLLASSVAVPDGFELDTPYSLRGMSDVADLKILPDVDNYRLYHVLKEFYEEAGEGVELWLMGFAKDTKVSDWFTPDAGTGKAPAEKLLDAANGKLTGLFTSFSPDENYVINMDSGVDEDVALAQQKAQLLAENYTANNYAPFFVLLEAYAFNGNHIELTDLLEGEDNRTGIVQGDTKMRTGDVTNYGAANHVVAGRLAKTQVHENPGKVKNGSLEALTMFMLDEAIEMYPVVNLHDKGYITFRTHVRKSGYYVTDCPLATGLNDDYHYLTARRVIDKAFRIAHNIASNEILNDFDLENDGTISPFYAKTVEGNIERAIAEQMTARGELSASKTDKNDLGVAAKFDLTKNVATTGRIEMSLKVRPKGYARWFDILLGYDVTLNQE